EFGRLVAVVRLRRSARARRGGGEKTLRKDGPAHHHGWRRRARRGAGRAPRADHRGELPLARLGEDAGRGDPPPEQVRRHEPGARNLLEILGNKTDGEITEEEAYELDQNFPGVNEANRHHWFQGKLHRLEYHEVKRISYDPDTRKAKCVLTSEFTPRAPPGAQ